MRKKFILPENALNKNQIMDLIYDSCYENEDSNVPDYGDLASYAESHFGSLIMKEGFSRYTNEEIQEWYYREYLPDRQADIVEGYDRGQ